MTVKISVVEVTSGKSRIKVESPYHPDFPKHAKNLGGKWNANDRVWLFDSRDEDSVRDLCRDCFGTAGETELELVDCRIRLTGSQGDSVWFAGRRIARRGARDWPVKLGESVVVIEGDFRSTGGSRKYPSVTFVGDSITLEVRDVPAVLVQREKDNDPENVTILSEIPERIELATINIAVDASLEFLREALSISDEEIVANALKIYYTQERKKGNVD